MLRAMQCQKTPVETLLTQTRQPLIPNKKKTGRRAGRFGTLLFKMSSAARLLTCSTSSTATSHQLLGGCRQSRSTLFLFILDRDIVLIHPKQIHCTYSSRHFGRRWLQLKCTRKSPVPGPILRQPAAGCRQWLGVMMCY